MVLGNVVSQIPFMVIILLFSIISYLVQRSKRFKGPGPSRTVSDGTLSVKLLMACHMKQTINKNITHATFIQINLFYMQNIILEIHSNFIQLIYHSESQYY